MLDERARFSVGVEVLGRRGERGGNREEGSEEATQEAIDVRARLPERCNARLCAVCGRASMRLPAGAQGRGRGSAPGTRAAFPSPLGILAGSSSHAPPRVEMPAPR